MGLIKEFSSYIDEKKLMEAFLNSRVTEDKYKKAFKKAFKSLNSWEINKLNFEWKVYFVSFSLFKKIVTL